MEVKIPRTWDDLEVKYLIKHAGRDTVHDIASVLERSRHDVRRECAIRGLNARAPKSALTICPSCGKARTGMSRLSGLCRVCTVDVNIRRTKAMIALELASALPEFKREHGHLFEPRVARAQPVPRPHMPRTATLSPAERQRVEDEYDAAIEQVELVEARREYTAVRVRLYRLRVALNDRRP